MPLTMLSKLGPGVIKLCSPPPRLRFSPSSLSRAGGEAPTDDGHGGVYAAGVHVGVRGHQL